MTTLRRINQDDLRNHNLSVVISTLLRAAGLERDAASPLADLAALLPNVFAALAQAIVDFRVPITGTRGFDAAQVTAGGVMTDGFDPRTLQSRLCPGLHAAGEVLDVDAYTGGFNLQIAWATGHLAGVSAAERE